MADQIVVDYKANSDELLKDLTALISKNESLEKQINQLSGTTLPNFQKQSTQAYASDQVNKFNDAIDNSGKSIQSARGILQGYITQLVQLRQQGQENSKQFLDISEKAKVLQQQLTLTRTSIQGLASGREILEGLSSAAGGVTGAFSVATGVAGLFGDANEDLQKKFVQLQATLTILNGLQEIQNVLRQDNAGITAITTIANNLWNKSLTVSQSALKAVGVESEVTADILRTTLIASGIGLVILAIGLLIENFDAVKEALSGTSKAQAALNEVSKDAANSIVKETVNYQSLINVVNDTNLSFASRQQALLKLQSQYPDYLKNLNLESSTTEEITAATDKLSKALVAKANIEAAESVLIKTQTDLINKKLISQQADNDLSTTSGIISNELFSLVTLGYGGATAKAQDYADAQKKSIPIVSTLTDFIKDQNKALSDSGDGGAATLTQQLKDVKTIADSRVTLDQQANQKQISDRKAAALADYNLEIDAAGANVALQQAAAAKYTKAEIDINEDAQKIIIQGKIDSLKAQEIATGSSLQVQRDLAIKEAQAEADLSLNNIKLTAKQRELIEVQTTQKLLDINLDFDNKKNQIQLNGINAQLAFVNKGTQDELDLQKQKVDQSSKITAAGYVKDFQDGKISYEEYLSELNELQQTHDGQIRDLDVAFAIQTNEEKLKLNARLLQDANEAQGQFYDEQRSALSLQLANNEISQSDFSAKSLEIDKNQHEQQLANAQKYGGDLKTINKAIADDDEKLAQLKVKNAKAAFDEMITLAQDLSSVLNNISQTQLNNELTNLQDQLSKKQISQASYDKQVKEAKIKEAKQQKELSIFNAVIKGAEAVVGFLSNPGGIPGVILSIAAGVTTGVEIGEISSQPLPAFAKGKKPGQRAGMSLVGELGPEMMYVPDSAHILTAEKTKLYKDSLNAMSAGTFEDMIYHNYVMPEIMKIKAQFESAFNKNISVNASLNDKGIINAIRESRGYSPDEMANAMAFQEQQNRRRGWN